MMKLLKFDSIPYRAHLVLYIIMFASFPVLFLLLQSVYSQEFFVLDKANIIQIVLIVVLAGLIVSFFFISWMYSFSTDDFIKLIQGKGGDLYEIRSNIIIDEGIRKKLELIPYPIVKEYAQNSIQSDKSHVLTNQTFSKKIGGMLYSRLEGSYPSAKIGDLLIHTRVLDAYRPISWDWEADSYEYIIYPIKFRWVDEIYPYLDPANLIKGTLVNLFSLGDYSRFGSIKLDIYPSKHNETGNSMLDQALHESLKKLMGDNEVITLQVKENWLRVKIRGGPWLGGKFGRRISEAIEFTELLVKLLSPHVKLYDLDKRTIDFIGYDYRVRQIEPSEESKAV